MDNLHRRLPGTSLCLRRVGLGSLRSENSRLMLSERGLKDVLECDIGDYVTQDGRILHVCVDGKREVLSYSVELCF
jgi:hypothetical protein